MSICLSDSDAGWRHADHGHGATGRATGSGSGGPGALALSDWRRGAATSSATPGRASQSEKAAPSHWQAVLVLGLGPGGQTRSLSGFESARRQHYGGLGVSELARTQTMVALLDLRLLF